MVIVGINAFHADASAAIIVDGVLVAAIQEERFTRVKHCSGFPLQSIQFCMKQAGLTYKEVDHFAIGRDPKAKLVKKVAYAASSTFSGKAAVKERLSNSRKVMSIETELSVASMLHEKLLKSKIKYVEHHRSHIASAFYASPFEKAACLSIDSSGDFTTTMAATGYDTKLDIITSVDFPNSLGIFYTAFTQLLGFPDYGDEYKVMGLASYGEPRYVSQLHDVVKLKTDGLFSLNQAYFNKGTAGVITYADNIPLMAPMYNETFIKKFGRAREPQEPISQYHKDLAASVQKMTELVIFHMLTALHKETKLTNLCLAGGVAQNSVANGKIIKNTPFENVYIPMAANDAGISIGAALYVQHHILKLPRVASIRSAFTGSSFTNEDIKAMLDSKGIAYTQLDDAELFERITNCLIDGGIAGWVSGAAEFGPRALGNRSVIADPRRADVKDIINSKIKRRENFRPFAPSVLREHVSEYFETTEEVLFMEKVFPVKAEKRDKIPAVTHIDGTGRPQTVDKLISPRYYSLIESFAKKTGVPVLLNTSFNENEPMVNTPSEALDCFLRTEMDMLVMENILITRNR